MKPFVNRYKFNLFPVNKFPEEFYNPYGLRKEIK